MLKHRLMVAIPLVAVVALIFCCPGVLGKVFFSLLAMPLLGLAVHESHLLLDGKPYDGYEILLWIVSLALIGCPWVMSCPLLGDAAIGLIALLAGFILCFHYGTSKEEIGRLTAFFTTGVYVCWSLSFLVKLFFLPSGALLLGYLVLITKLADIGAFFAGTATAKLMPNGNHKLAPKVSPKKSWEGLIGGAVLTVAGSLLYRHFAGGALGLQLWEALALGLLSPVVGLIGDLAESALKRAAGAKDSGKIPGMGGALDMLDSLIPMGVLFFLWVKLV